MHGLIEIESAPCPGHCIRAVRLACLSWGRRTMGAAKISADRVGRVQFPPLAPRRPPTSPAPHPPTLHPHEHPLTPTLTPPTPPCTHPHAHTHSGLDSGPAPLWPSAAVWTQLSVTTNWPTGSTILALRRGGKRSTERPSACCMTDWLAIQGRGRGHTKSRDGAHCMRGRLALHVCCARMQLTWLKPRRGRWCARRCTS